MNFLFFYEKSLFYGTFSFPLGLPYRALGLLELRNAALFVLMPIQDWNPSQYQLKEAPKQYLTKIGLSRLAGV